MEAISLTPENYQKVFELIKTFSDQYLLLPKSLEEIKQISEDFRIVVEDDKVVACAVLDVFTETLAEVRTLAVAPESQGRGFGKVLVEDCENRAREIGIKRIFALTYKDNFFHKLGYRTVDKNSLPEKVLKTCVNCSLYNNCQEIAVLKDL